MPHLLQEMHLDEMGGGARDIVLDVVGEFRGRNSSGGKNLQVLHWATPQGKVPLSGADSWGRLL